MTLAVLLPAAPAPARAESVPARVLRFGVIAEQPDEPDRMLRVHADFLSDLRRRLAPRKIEVANLVIARDLPALSRALKEGQVDMLIETVFPTFILQDQSRALTPSMVVVRRGEREYHTVFFTTRASKLHALEDLRGRTLVLQVERSTSAFAMPRAELARHGIGMVPEGEAEPGRAAASYLLAGAELNQAIWVLNGRGDAGAFNQGDWASLPTKVRDGLRIFHQTQPLLRGLLSFRTGLESDVRKACEEVLLEMGKDASGRTALAHTAGISRFEPLTRSDLQALDGWRTAFQSLPRR